jgi:tetraacyldisaccharide 4'-kinase
VVSADPALLALFGETPTLIAHLMPVAPPPPGPQLAFAGIGKPWKMERALTAAGCELADFAPLADHARITDATMEFLSRRAADLGAGLLTSEKDWVRLSPDWRSRVTPWPVRVVFDDETALQRLLASVLG